MIHCLFKYDKCETHGDLVQVGSISLPARLSAGQPQEAQHLMNKGSGHILSVQRVQKRGRTECFVQVGKNEYDLREALAEF